MSLHCLQSLQTESRNPLSVDLDRKTTQQLVALMNNEDVNATRAVAHVIPRIAGAIDALYPRLQAGGRLIYIGAGTSGRLGVLDAAELPPTFNASAEKFVALIAGGREAMFEAQEGAEDDQEAAVKDLSDLNLKSTDSVLGIASSGRTPYVLGGLRYAKSLKCLTIGVVCVDPSEIGASGACDFLLNPVTGAEVVTGSTRLKAGTATKLILNTISTVSMIKIGKTYGNLMVDLKPTNLKLQQRSRNIFRMICGPRFYSAREPGRIISLIGKDSLEVTTLINDHFELCGRNLKTSLVVGMTGSTPQQAVDLLSLNNGNLKAAIESATNVESAVDELSLSEPDESGLSSVTSSTSIEEDSPLNQPNTSQIATQVTSMFRNHNNNLPTLIIDGGGSKTAAVITLASGFQARGLSGPSSVTTSSVDDMISSILQATREAISHLPESDHFDARDTTDLKGKFSLVWVGLAGIVSGDKDVYRSRFEALAEIFPDVKLTGDTQLLASVLINYPKSTCLALIAGTGCSCMGYALDGNEYTFLGKNGGWGPDLGDEGAGYFIGLQIIKKALYFIDISRIQKSLTRRTAKQNNKNAAVLSDVNIKSSTLLEMVTDHFNQTPESLLQFMIEFMKSPHVNERRAKIAGLARLALENIQSPSPDKYCLQIIQESAKLVARTALPFISDGLFISNSVLVMAGSLLCMGRFRKMVLAEFADMGVEFKAVEVISDPAITAGKLLPSS